MKNESVGIPIELLIAQAGGIPVLNLTDPFPQRRPDGLGLVQGHVAVGEDEAGRGHRDGRRSALIERCGDASLSAESPILKDCAASIHILI